MHTACQSCLWDLQLQYLYQKHCDFVCKCGLLLTLRSAHSWFILGQLFASLALYFLNASDPYNYKTPIYTQVRHRTGRDLHATR